MAPRIFLWIRTHKGILIVVFLLVLFILWKIPQKKESPYETATTTLKDLLQEVVVTGKVQSQDSVDLAFEKGGKISTVLVEVGDSVARGDMLLRLDASDLSANLSQAEANLLYEEATLAKLLIGAKPEDIQVSEVTLENAEASFLDSESSLRQYLTDGYTKMDDAITGKTDKFFTNPKTNPALSIAITDSRLAIDLESLRKKIQIDLSEWNTLRTGVPTDDGTQLIRAKTFLTDATIFLEKLAQAVNSLQGNSSISQTTIDAYKLDVSTARTTVNTALGNLVAAEEKWRAAKSAVALAKQQLALKKSGATPEEVSAQKARVASARASITSYRSQLEKLNLTSPISGIVTRQDARRGAIAGVGTPLVTIQSKGSYKIEANIPEIDIAKIEINDTADIVLDAYGDELIFRGTVAQIDPAERVIDGVPTYKVTLIFEDLEGRARSGMTANVMIVTDERKGVLAIPARAISEHDKKKIVRVLPENGIPQEREITTGLRSSDGLIEIVSGILPGEQVITFEKVSK